MVKDILSLDRMFFYILLCMHVSIIFIIILHFFTIISLHKRMPAHFLNWVILKAAEPFSANVHNTDHFSLILLYNL